MTVALIIGLVLSNILNQSENIPNYMVRKFFHIMILYLFVPGVFYNLKMMVFAFNCVSVLLIFIEILRYNIFQYSKEPNA